MRGAGLRTRVNIDSTRRANIKVAHAGALPAVVHKRQVEDGSDADLQQNIFTRGPPEHVPKPTAHSYGCRAKEIEARGSRPGRKKNFFFFFFKEDRNRANF